jgi:hypothetical protein
MGCTSVAGLVIYTHFNLSERLINNQVPLLWFFCSCNFFMSVAVYIHHLDVSCIGENASKSSSSEKDLLNMRDGTENYGSECPTATELMERVASSFSIPGVSIAQAQSSVDPECVKSQSGSEPSLPAALHVAKARKLTVERSDPK